MPEIVAFDPMTLLLIAALNPAVIITGFLLGRDADQWQKLLVAAFAAALLGFVLYWIAAALGFMPVKALGGEAGLMVMQFVIGLGWAMLGYYCFSKKKGQ